MNQKILIHFAHIFERKAFGDAFKNHKGISTLTNTFCILTHWSITDRANIIKLCPKSKIQTKTIENKRATYKEWRRWWQ